MPYYTFTTPDGKKMKLWGEDLADANRAFEHYKRNYDKGVEQERRAQRQTRDKYGRYR